MKQGLQDVVNRVAKINEDIDRLSKCLINHQKELFERPPILCKEDLQFIWRFQRSIIEQLNDSRTHREVCRAQYNRKPKI